MSGNRRVVNLQSKRKLKNNLQLNHCRFPDYYVLSIKTRAMPAIHCLRRKGELSIRSPILYSDCLHGKTVKFNNSILLSVVNVFIKHLGFCAESGRA